MGNPLAITTFSSGPKDTLASKDIYKIGNKEVINSIQTISAKLGVDLSGILNFGNAGLTGILSKVGDAVGINKDVLTSRMLGTSTALKTSFQNLEKSSKSDILESFSDTGQVGVIMGDVSSMCKASDYSSVSSLGSFVNEYTKTSAYSIKDNDAIASLVSGVIKEGSALGMNGLFSSMTAGITDSNLMSKIVSQSLPGLIKSGDLHSLSSIANGLLGHSLDFIYPSFANDLAKAYGFKGVLDILAPKADYQAIMLILGATNSNWDAFTHQNGYSNVTGYSVENGVSIVKIQNASTDFQKIIADGIKTEADDSRRKYYALAQYFRKTDMLDEIKHYFPGVILPVSRTNSLNTSRKNKTVDPRVLLNITANVVANADNIASNLTSVLNSVGFDTDF